MSKMLIFVAGVHGVGKGYLCKKYSEENDVNYQSASQLIRDHGDIEIPLDKLASNLDRNQLILISALESLLNKHKKILLDGHFCLLQKNGGIKSLDKSTFQSLCIDGVILLENDSETIIKRIIERDGAAPSYDIDALIKFERENAFSICEDLNIPIKILSSSTIEEFTRCVNEIERKR